MRTQLVVARYLAEHGFPHAESAGSGRSGVDILGLPGVALEVKARREFEPLAWLRQAEGQTGLPTVVFRPDGMGEASISSWGFLMRFGHGVALLRDAGYGTPLDIPPDQ